MSSTCDFVTNRKLRSLQYHFIIIADVSKFYILISPNITYDFSEITIVIRPTSGSCCFKY